MINTAFMVRFHPFFDTPMFYQTTAHELAHVWQGARCGWPRDDVEASAQIYSYDVLWRAAKDGNEMAYHALIYALRRDMIMSAIDLMYQDGRDPDELLDRLVLTDNERRYFKDFDQWSAKWMGRYYTTKPVLMLLDNDEVISNGLHEAVDMAELRNWLLLGAVEMDREYR